MSDREIAIRLSMAVLHARKEAEMLEARLARKREHIADLERQIDALTGVDTPETFMWRGTRSPA